MDYNANRYYSSHTLEIQCHFTVRFASSCFFDVSVIISELTSRPVSIHEGTNISTLKPVYT